MNASETSRAEAERLLVSSAERHREVVASMRELGRPEAGQHVAVKAVGRAVELVSFALKRAAEAGVAFERLVELTGWEPDLVQEALELEVREPTFVARLVPARRRRPRGLPGRDRLPGDQAPAGPHAACARRHRRRGRRRHRRRRPPI